MSPPSFETLQQAYLDTLDYIIDHETLLQPVNHEVVDALREQAKVATTWTQLGSLALLTPCLNLGMRPIAPLTDTPLATTLFQPGNATLDWYFMYSNSTDEAYTFILFAVPLCVPDIAKKYNLNPYDTYIYSPSAGYGKRMLQGDWSTSPRFYCQAIYTPLSESTFTWEAILPNNAQVTGASFECLALGTFHLRIAWNDKTNTHSIDSTLTSTIPPTYNGDGGCVPCIAGLGTSYWSYTNMKTKTVYNNEPPVSGSGWFDHQWLQAGKLNGNIAASIINVLSWWSPSPKTTRWFWITVKDDKRGVQYMILVSNPTLLSTNPADPQPTFQPTILNRYDNQHPPQYLNGTQARVTVTRSVQLGDYVYPIRYAIQIFDGEVYNYVLQAEFGNAIINLPNGVPNIESPGILYDGNNPIEPIGSGFLEANQMGQDDVVRETTLLQSGMPVEKWSLFANTSVPTSTVLLSVLFLILIILFLVSLFYGVYKTFLKRKKLQQ